MIDDHRHADINISRIPVDGIGGLGLVAGAGIIAFYVPALRWAAILALIGGAAIGLLLMARNRRPGGVRPSAVRSSSSRWSWRRSCTSCEGREAYPWFEFTARVFTRNLRAVENHFRREWRCCVSVPEAVAVSDRPSAETHSSRGRGPRRPCSPGLRSRAGRALSSTRRYRRPGDGSPTSSGMSRCGSSLTGCPSALVPSANIQ